MFFFYTVLTFYESFKNDNSPRKLTLQCVAQFPAGTSFRPKKSKLSYFRWDFNSSSTKSISRNNEHLRYQLMVLAGFLVEKRANKKGSCSGE